jgi:spore coat polysaccharide biosynthesis predicted glycosyltransferase SpsG
MVTLAENQLEVAARLAEAGAAISLGWHSGVSDRQLEDAVRAAVRDPARVRAMGRKAARIADGRGAERVVGVLEALVEARTGPGADAAADHGAAE